MLTPAFDIKQDHNSILLTIRAPYTNIKDCDVYIYENEIKFFSEPYFLRLNLPGNVVESASASIKYDADCGTFELVVPKETPGEHFEDLELLTKLLAPKLKPGQALIQELDEVPDEDIDDEDGDIWQIEQVPYEQADGVQSRLYGFNRSKHGVLERMQEDLPRICDIKDPGQKSVWEAREERLAEEQRKFDELHFLDDYFDERGEIQALIDLELDYTTEFDFTEEEREILAKLPTRQYVMDKDDKLRCLLGLADLVYAWAYTNRVNGAEWNSESGWTVAKLSATLSHLEEFTSLKAVMISCVRRTLIYPLYRHYGLAMQCWRDAAGIFRQGTKRVLKCLLDIHRALQDDHDGRFVLNELYISDYCVWLQRQCKASRLQEIAQRLENVEVSKDDLGLRIAELETAALAVGDLDIEAEAAVPDDAEERSLDSDDDSDSSTSAQDSDDYHSCEESNSSNAPSSSDSEPPDNSEPSSLASSTSVSRNV